MIRRAHSFFEPAGRRVVIKKKASKTPDTFTAAEVCAILEGISAKLDILIAGQKEIIAMMDEMLGKTRYRNRLAKL